MSPTNSGLVSPLISVRTVEKATHALLFRCPITGERNHRPVLDPMKQTPLITSRDLAAELCVSYQTMCSWSKSGKVPAIRMPDGSWRYRRADIDAWIADRLNR